MDSYKSNKKQWAQYLIALALHAQEAMANDTTTEDTVKTRSLKTDIQWTPIITIGVIFITYLIYASYNQNAGALIVTGSKKNAVKPKKVKKKEYLREDNKELFAELDKNGPYPDSNDNPYLIDFEAFLSLIKVINYRTFAEFHARRQELFDQRISYFKQKNMEEYRKCIQAISVEFGDVYYKAKHDALVYLEFDVKSFEETVKLAQSKASTRQQMEKIEHEVRVKVEEENAKMRNIEETKDVIKKIHMEKLQKDFQSETNVEAEDPDRPVLMMIERTQVMDTIFLKYNMKQFDLTRAIQHYKLETDPEVVALRAFL